MWRKAINKIYGNNNRDSLAQNDKSKQLCQSEVSDKMSAKVINL